MVDPTLPGGLSPLDPTRSKAGSSVPDGPNAPEQGAAFRALLERLEDGARKLQQDGARVDDAADLEGAVDRAKNTLDEALSLSDRLLEAYRATRTRAESGAGEAGEGGERA